MVQKNIFEVVQNKNLVWGVNFFFFSGGSKNLLRVDKKNQFWFGVPKNGEGDKKMF